MESNGENTVVVNLGHATYYQKSKNVWPSSWKFMIFTTTIILTPTAVALYAVSMTSCLPK